MLPDTTDYASWIGRKVNKTGIKKNNREPKPFKSGFKVNTVKALIVSPYTTKPAFTFNEDDSIVDCYVCKLVE